MKNISCETMTQAIDTAKGKSTEEKGAFYVINSDNKFFVADTDTVIAGEKVVMKFEGGKIKRHI